MTTRRYALDEKSRKIFIGSKVKYNNRIFLVEDIQYLDWTIKQFLTLSDSKNKNKRIEFITPDKVKAIH